MGCYLDALNLCLPVQQGATFRLRVRVRRSSRDGGGPFTLTGWTPRGQVRANSDEVGIPLATLSVTVESASEGLLLVRLGADVTAALSVAKMRFDVELVRDLDPTDIWRVARGVLYLDPETTK